MRAPLAQTFAVEKEIPAILTYLSRIVPMHLHDNTQSRKSAVNML